MNHQETIQQLVVEFLDKTFCHQDIPYIIEHLSREVSWMGEDLISSDYDEIVLRLLNQQKRYTNCTICAPAFQISKLSDTIYSVNGTFLMHPDSKEHQMLSPVFKASFILELTPTQHLFRMFHYNPISGDMNHKLLQDTPIYTNNQLNVILDSVQGGLAICRLDANFSYLYMSDKTANLFGYTQDELLAITNGYATRLIYPSDLTRVMSDFKDILKQKSGSFTSKYRVLCKDGSIKWILDTRSIGTLKSGESILNVLYLDVTDSENTHLLLEERNTLLNNIYDSILCGIIQIRIVPDQPLEYEAVNKAAWTIMGYESEEACLADGPRIFIDKFSRDHVTRYWDTLLPICNSSEYIEEEYLVDCMDGQKRWISGATRLFQNSNGDLILQSTLIDTTRQRQLEQKLQEEQAEIQRLHNARHTRIFQSEYNSLTNINLEDGTFEREIFATPYFSRITQTQGNYQEIYDEMLNDIHPEDVLHYRDSFSLESFRRIAASDTPPESISVSYRLKNAPTLTWLESTAFFIPDGNKISVSITNKNITRDMQQRQLLEDALSSARDASLAKSSFLSSMSHDIRTPLNAIMGMTDIATAHLNDTDRVANCLQKISISSNHLLGLINEVLDMSRIESGKILLAQNPFRLPELIDNLLTMVKPLLQAKKQELQLQILDLKQENVIGDDLRLQQILMNILSNAIKYTPDHGKIRLCLTERSSDILYYGCYEFVIEDNGIGMSQEFLQHIFEPFSRESSTAAARYEGTGLGMAISQNLVRMMHGRIDVDSVKDEGSKFTVTIYLEHQSGNAAASAFHRADTPSEEANTNTPLTFQDKRILLVEDNELNMEIAENILADKGLIIDKAWNGKEAFDMFAASPVGYYDLIFMDIQMPIMNGYEATSAIRCSEREDSKTIPILAMTANAFVEDIQAAQSATMNEHIAKPVNPKILFQALARWLK